VLCGVTSLVQESIFATDSRSPHLFFRYYTDVVGQLEVETQVYRPNIFNLVKNVENPFEQQQSNAKLENLVVRSSFIASVQDTLNNL